MRIGVNCFMLDNNIGGMRQYFLRLFNELLQHDHENTYVLFHFTHNIKELDHLRNDRWKKTAVLLNSQDDICLHLDKIDLYFCPFGALWPRPLKVPSVVTLPDIQEKYHPEFFSDMDLYNRELYYDPSTQIADRVIAISNFTKESIAKHHGRSVDKIKVAYLCADESLISNTTGVVPGDIQLPDKFIYFPANRWLHKNHDALLKALVIIRDKHGKLPHCVFTGHDVEGGYPLAEKLNDYGLTGQAQVYGYLSAADVNLIYKKAEMLCFPSLFEGFGMPILEAMTLGCPVVCSRTTSLPEVGGDAALYFDPTDPEDIARKIMELWSNKDLRKRCIAEGYKQARLFSAHAMASSHIAAFTEAKASFSLSRYYFNKYVYDPSYRMKMKFTAKYKYHLA